MTGEGAGPLSYGVDVGGTKILGVVIGPHGDVLAERRVATPHLAAATAARGNASGGRAGGGRQGSGDHPGEAVADAIVQLLSRLHGDLLDADATDVGAGAVARRRRGPGSTAERADPADLGAAPIGIGIAGLVDRAGLLRFSPNLATASGAAIGNLVQARLPGRTSANLVQAHNDATCAALAELTLGAARGIRQGLVITLGTGIGGALVVDSRVHTGANGFAGEFGHMVVDPNGPPCPCGSRGCWERYASGAGLARLARDAALAGTLHRAVQLAGGDPEHVTGEHVTAAAAAGDVEALHVVDELGWWVGLGLANLVAAYDPERIVLGGGLGRAGEMLLDPARRALGALVEGGSARDPVPVVAAWLGERAGAVGAALAARTGSLDLP